MNQTQEPSPQSSLPAERALSQRIILLLLALILLLGIGLRAYDLSGESPWCDEVLTLRHLPAPTLHVFLKKAFIEDPRLPLAPIYYVMEYAWSTVFGAAPLALRWLSITVGALTILLIFDLARRLYNPLAGLFAAFALAVSMPHVYYSQEIRFYALFVLFALISLWGFTAATQQNRWWGWPIHFLANALMLWTHAFAPLLFAAQGLFLLAYYPRSVRRWLVWGLAHVALLVFYLAWMRVLEYDFAAHSTAYAGALPTGRDLLNVAVIFSGGRFSNENPASYLPFGLSFDYAITGITVASALILLGNTLRPFGDVPPETCRNERAAFGLLIFWIVIPALGLFAASWLWRPCFIYRYVLYSALGCSVVLGAGLAAIPSARIRIFFAVFLCAAFGYQNLALPRPFRADYQSAAKTMQQSVGPETVILAFKTFNALAVQYNTPVDPSRIIVYEGFIELCTDARKYAAQGQTVWVVFHHWDQTEEFENAMNAAHLLAVRHRFAGIPPLTLYRINFPGTG